MSNIPKKKTFCRIPCKKMLSIYIKKNFKSVCSFYNQAFDLRYLYKN